MWLAETAADTESLNCLRNTASSSRCWRRTSASHSAAERRWGLERYRRRHGRHHAPYLVRFDSGVSIAVFFYNGPFRGDCL